MDKYDEGKEHIIDCYNRLKNLIDETIKEGYVDDDKRNTLKRAFDNLMMALRKVEGE
jgi:hypothetical protein